MISLCLAFKRRFTVLELQKVLTAQLRRFSRQHPCQSYMLSSHLAQRSADIAEAAQPAIWDIWPGEEVLEWMTLNASWTGKGQKKDGRGYCCYRDNNNTCGDRIPPGSVWNHSTEISFDFLCVYLMKHFLKFIRWPLLTAHSHSCCSAMCSPPWLSASAC